LVDARTKLYSELQARHPSSSCYLAYLNFQKARAEVRTLPEKIARKKLYFHNAYETLKGNFGGKGIEIERKGLMQNLTLLTDPLSIPEGSAEMLLKQYEYREKFADFEREKRLKDVLKMIKNNLFSHDNIKNQWTQLTSRVLCKGGMSYTLQENNQTVRVKIPHAAAAIATLVKDLSDEAVDRMNISAVKDFFRRFKEIIVDRQARRSNVITWCSCFGLTSTVRKDETINVYQQFLRFNVDEVKEEDVRLFSFNNAVVRPGVLPVVPIRGRSPS